MSAQPLSDYKKDISHGIWFSLHVNGEAAKTPELMRAYAHNFRNMCDKMGCSCENHCIQMLKDHPPEHYFDMVDKDGVPCGCFYHSILCHNMVNQRLGKPTYTYDQIYPLFRGANAHAAVVKPCSAPDASMPSAAPVSSPGSSVPPGSQLKPVSLSQLTKPQEKLFVNSSRRRAKIQIIDA